MMAARLRELAAGFSHGNQHVEVDAGRHSHLLSRCGASRLHAALIGRRGPGRGSSVRGRHRGLPGLGRSAARALLRRAQFQYAPKHASWPNMAEIEISILERQCLGRRLMYRDTMRREVNAWQRQRNAERRGIDWTFTRQDADRKLRRDLMGVNHA
jgi:hypothetical protein